MKQIDGDIRCHGEKQTTTSGGSLLAASVQAGASSIGTAPQGASSNGVLPSLTTSGQSAAADQTPGSSQAAGTAQAGASTGAAFDPTKMLAQGRWMGPLATMGGGLAAFKGVQSGSSWLKIGGIGAALGGLALTAMGFKAKGVEAGTKATEQQAVIAMQQLQQQYEATMQNLSSQATTQITSLQQQLQQAQGGSQTSANSQGSSTSGTGLGVGPGLDTTVVPGSQQSSGQTGDVSTVSPTSGQGIQAIVGTSVDLATGASTLGTQIAKAGSFKIEQIAGDTNGYATLDEANAAARQSMSTELMGSSFLRWMVIESGGRFYGAIGKQIAEGQQAAAMPSTAGKVVAWSAMNHVSENGVDGWKAYSWTQNGGGQSIDVPYATSNIFGNVSGGGDRVDTALPRTTGTVASNSGFDPSTQVGLSFSINAATTSEGNIARGGALQVQRFLDVSAGGFDSAEQAASAARAARAQSGQGDQWSRWITLQGADGRYYLYEGSIVSRATKELQAAPVHVFGAGFAEYFDGSASAWKAVSDQQAA